MPNRVNWAGLSCTSSIDCDDMEKLPMKFDIKIVELRAYYVLGIRLALFYFMTGIF